MGGRSTFVVGTTDAVNALGFWGAPEVEYCEGYIFKPLDDKTLATIFENGNRECFPDAAAPPKGLAEHLGKASVGGGLAFIYLEAFGGCEDADVVAWVNGQLMYGPEHHPLAPSEGLAAIGVPGLATFRYKDLLPVRARQ